MTATRNLIVDGADGGTQTVVSWPYPTVNVKVIDKENNEAGLTFLSIPDSEEWATQTATAKANGMIWGHDTAVSEGGSSHPVMGYPNQMTSGIYNSGFEFSIETTADDEAEYRPAIGFSAFADFTPENLGEERYDALVSALEDLDEQYYYYGWYLPDADVLTDLGIHIYGKTDGVTNDITDGVSFGIFAVDENTLLLNYGAVMVDDANGHEGTGLELSDEEELVWSDGVQDGYITGEWWIVVDPLYAGGTGTPVDPFQIETAEQLDNVRENLDRHFILTNNIDLSGYDNWEPIGTFVPASDEEEDEETPDLNYAFIGTFNGNGYIVSNLTVNQPEGVAVGLFGCVVGTTTKIIEFEGMHGPGCMGKAERNLSTLSGVQSVDVVLNRAMIILTDDYQLSDDELNDFVDNLCNFNWESTETFDHPVIYDLIVEDADVTGYMMAGGIVGYAVGCTLDNADLNGANTISGSQMVGGIVGGGFNDFVECDASADIVVFSDEYGMASMAGVLAGGMEESSIINCTATGTVTADGDYCYGLGGLAGCAFESPLIENCESDVTIIVNGQTVSLIGGLLGFTGTNDGEPTLVSNCSVNADITVSDSAARIGGITGGGFYIEEYAAYYPDPSVFEIANCDTQGGITGGFEFVGSIAGNASGSIVEDCDSTMDWNGSDDFEQVGSEGV